VTDAPAAKLGYFQANKALDAITTQVASTEPCFYLGELNLPSRSGKSKSRYQLLRVVRNDALVTAYVYLGPAARFQADQFQMIGGVVDENGKGQAFHTVQELQEGAVELRSRAPYRQMEPTDLQGAWHNQIEEQGRAGKHQSTFGLSGQIVRA